MQQGHLREEVRNADSQAPYQANCISIHTLMKSQVTWAPDEMGEKIDSDTVP